MKLKSNLFVAGAIAAGLALSAAAAPANAQSVGYVTGIPGPDPAGGDELGWGPAYRPETSFYQPGTLPTPGEIAARGYYERTGRPVYPPVGYYAPTARRRGSCAAQLITTAMS